MNLVVGFRIAARCHIVDKRPQRRHAYVLQAVLLGSQVRILLCMAGIMARVGASTSQLRRYCVSQTEPQPIPSVKRVV